MIFLISQVTMKRFKENIMLLNHLSLFYLRDESMKSKPAVLQSGKSSPDDSMMLTPSSLHTERQKIVSSSWESSSWLSAQLIHLDLLNDSSILRSSLTEASGLSLREKCCSCPKLTTVSRHSKYSKILKLNQPSLCRGVCSLMLWNILLGKKHHYSRIFYAGIYGAGQTPRE